MTTGLLEPGMELTVQFNLQGRVYEVQGRAVQTGLASPAGLALIAFPDKDESFRFFRPFRLASGLPRPDTRVTTYGFFSEGNQWVFKPFASVRVQEVWPGMLVSQPLGAPTNLVGMQGGPVLNGRGEVMALYAGDGGREHTPLFSPWRIQAEAERVDISASYAVPAERIGELVRAYYNGGKEFRPVRWNGLDIEALNVDERLFRVFTFRPATRLEKSVGEHYLGAHANAFVSVGTDIWGGVVGETYLELLPGGADAVALELWIEQYDGNMREVSVSLKNGHITGRLEGPAQYLFD